MKKVPLRGFSLRRYAVTRYAVTRFTNNPEAVLHRRTVHLDSEIRFSECSLSSPILKRKKITVTNCFCL